MLSGMEAQAPSAALQPRSHTAADVRSVSAATKKVEDIVYVKVLIH